MVSHALAAGSGSANPELGANASTIRWPIPRNATGGAFSRGTTWSMRPRALSPVAVQRRGMNDRAEADASVASAGSYVERNALPSCRSIPIRRNLAVPTRMLFFLNGQVPVLGSPDYPFCGPEGQSSCSRCREKGEPTARKYPPRRASVQVAGNCVKNALRHKCWT